MSDSSLAGENLYVYVRRVGVWCLVMIADCSAVILAGGQSQRMGQDKAQILLGDKTLLQSVAERVAPLFLTTYVSVRDIRTHTDLPQIVDEQKGCGPLGGLISCLQRIETPWLFAVACDMPFVHGDLIQQLACKRDRHHAVVPVVQGHEQPLFAFYSRDALPVMQASLARQQGGLKKMLAQLDVCYVSEQDLLLDALSQRSFFDLDTPEDVAAAKRFT